MLYLVDGYNVTLSDPATTSLTLLEQREALVARLRVRGAELLGRGRIVVVFDGREGPGLSSSRDGGIELVYAHEHSADDEIVRIAAGAAGQVVVVTGDRELTERVRTHARAGGEGRAPSCCFEAAGKGDRRVKRARGSIARDAGTPRDAGSITREMSELWLSEDEK
ncbi:MAG: hypothetical protein HGB10_06425 [Coriobacteriia bacterium]|nr:hypothetical protein [Coriobacteriia bacterium]